MRGALTLAIIYSIIHAKVCVVQQLVLATILILIFCYNGEPGILSADLTRFTTMFTVHQLSCFMDELKRFKQF